LDLPEDYLGKELEIIVLKKEEGLVNANTNPPIKLSEKYKAVFSKEDASIFDEHTKAMRTAWNNS
jgi:hypothetical protein